MSESQLLLSVEERHRFVAYCQREAASLRGIMDQMDKLPGGSIAAKSYEIRFAAYSIVAADLERIEDAKP